MNGQRLTCVSVALLFFFLSAGTVQAKPKFRPFAGVWQVVTEKNDLGFLVIDRREKQGKLEIALETIKLRVRPANRQKTAIIIYGLNKRWRVHGRLLLDKITFKVLVGQLKLRSTEGETFVLDVAAAAIASTEYQRKAKAILKIEPARKRIAQAGKGFLLDAVVINKGPGGIPRDKVTLYISVPDSLTDLEIISSNRMANASCNDYHDQKGRYRVAWCSALSLGPGVPIKASFTARVFPNEQVFAKGGYFTAHVFISTKKQDGVIEVSAVGQEVTIRVNGNAAAPSEEPSPAQKRCYLECIGLGNKPGESFHEACSRCKRKCKFKDSSC